MNNLIKFHRLACFILLSFTFFLFPEVSQEQTANHQKLELSVPMDDGTLLATDIYLPNIKNPVPTVLIRTPYNKDGAKSAAEKFLKQNIAVVAQDCRGRYKSDGEFYPFFNERKDGLATIRWIRKQSWSNGKIGGWGGSYVGITQWAVSDSLDVFTPHLTGASIYDLLYPGSLFSLQTAFNWGLMVSAKEVNDDFLKGILKSYYILPLSSADDSVSYDVKFINDWIEHEKYDKYWQNMNFGWITHAPLLSVAGWYDIFLKQQISDFQNQLSNGNPGNCLIIGPWCHGSQGLKNDYGGKNKVGNPGEMIANFLVKYLVNDKKKVMSNPFSDKKYNLFIMERNEYFGSDVWPPKESEPTPFYFGNDNYLSKKIYRESGHSDYTYHPENPYPNFGGTALGQMVGPAIQNKNISRKDQLVFETEILDKPLTLLGNIQAELYVSSDAQCTDFVVCIQDVFPDGNIINIQEGGEKVNFSGIKPEKKELSVWATGYEIKTGHKLRVVITSSWFPRFNRSLNTCTPAFTAVKMKPANQTLYFGPATPSHVLLPVLIENQKN